MSKCRLCFYIRAGNEMHLKMILRISPKLAEDQCKVDWLQNHHLKLLRKILETIAKSPLAKAITKSFPFLGVSVPLKHPELSAQKLKKIDRVNCADLDMARQMGGFGKMCRV